MILSLLSISVSMSACTSVSRDGAPLSHPDTNNIADPIPRMEPLSKGGNPKSYVVRGKRYYPLAVRDGFTQTGVASWYGTKFHGRLTSNGERYDMYKMTAAHKTLPIPTYVKVTNLENNKSVTVRVNDRGPFVGDRIIDLSYVAAIKLDMTTAGTARVLVEAWQPPLSDTDRDKEKGNEKESAVYYLQLGSFANKGNAEKMVSNLLEITEEPIKLTVAQTKSGMMYRVRVGPYRQREKIETIELHFNQLGFNQQSLILKPIRTPIHKTVDTIDIEAIN